MMCIQKQYAQVVSVNGVYISTGSGTVASADTINNNATSTFANAGTVTVSTLNNSGITQGDGTYNISKNFTNTGTFTAGTSTVNYNGASTQNVAGVIYNNLTISNTAAACTAQGALTVNAALTLNTSSILDMATFALSGSLTAITGTGTLKTQNTSATPIPSGKTWTGAVLYNSSSAQTIVQGNYTDLNGTGGNRTLSSGTTGIAGIFTTGSGTYTTTGSTVDFNGSGAQTLPAFSFEGVTFSGGNTKTAGGSINVSNALTLGANTTLALGSNNITLQSTATNTARVAVVPTTASITYGTGKFIVERYIPGRRKYRLITSSVTTSASSSLSVGQEAVSIWGNWQNQANNSTGHVGTIITGGTTADGFDQNTTNASLYTYDATNRLYTGFTSANAKKTKYTPLKAGVAYYMFVYGDRLNTVYTNTPNYTTITASGTLLTGDQAYTTGSTIPLNGGSGKYTMLGNPFASPIDWGSVQKTNLANTYWGWDPNLNSTGGYITITTTGTVTLISPFTGSTGLNQYIQPGQGFFVQATAASPALTIREQDKVSNINLNAFRTTTNSIPLIAVNVFYNIAGSRIFADGALAAFDPAYSIAVTKEDAAKMTGADESVAFKTGNSLLSVDARPLPGTNDILALNMAKLTKPQYTLQVFSQKLDTGLHAYLEDKYLQTSLPLLLNDTNMVAFNVTADAGSFAPDRFRIVFNKSGLQQIVQVGSGIRIVPNPIKDQQVNIQFDKVGKGLYTLRFINQGGQQVLRQAIDYDGITPNKRITLDKQLPAGIYYLQLLSSKENYSKTFLIQ